MRKLFYAAVIASASLSAACSLLNGSHRHENHPLRGVEKLGDPVGGKEVVLVPMRHYNTEEGYAAVRRYLDSLKADGYVTFCEGVYIVPYHIDTINEITMADLQSLPMPAAEAYTMLLDTLRRKDRRIAGFSLGTGGYTDRDNASISGRGKKEKYVSQTSETLGLTTDRDIWVDYTLADMVEIYEKRYGEIRLTDYDRTTGLTEQYRPDDKTGMSQRLNYMLFPRNDYVVRRIVGSRRPRIAVVYGAAHIGGIKYFLKKQHGYRPERGYDAEKTVR